VLYILSGRNNILDIIFCLKNCLNFLYISKKSPKGYVTPSISIDTESVQSSDESSLQIDTSLKIESNLQIEPKTLSPDLKLPPIKCLDQIDCNKNGDHHPHFVHHIQSNPISNAGIIEQLFIDKRPSK